jgi:predicted dehydrogenase
VRVAIVGSGNIAGARHMPAIRSLGGRIDVVGVMDVELDRAQTFAAEWAIPNAFDSIAAMLDRARPELVIVCTPPVAHTGAVIECLDAGVSVWCEKPPTLSLAEYDEIQSHEGVEGPFVSYVFQHRFGSGAQRLRQSIASGELGRPLVGICNTVWYRSPEYYEVPWRGKWRTEGGGPTLGHGIHQMDLMLSLLGDWHEVRALMGTLDRDIEVEDVSLAAVTMESGAMMSVVNSILSPREESYLRFDFTDATVELSHTYGYDNSNWTWTPAAHVVDDARVASWAPADNAPSSHAAQLAELLDALAVGTRPRCSGDDGRRSLEFITGLYRSAITGKPVLRSELTPADPFYSALNGSSILAAADV